MGLDKQACSRQSAAWRNISVCAAVHMFGGAQPPVHMRVAGVAGRSGMCRKPTASSRTWSAERTSKSSDAPPDPAQTSFLVVRQIRLNTWRSTQDVRSQAEAGGSRSNMMQHDVSWL